MPVLCTLEDANSTKIQNAVLQQCTDYSIFSSVKLQHKGLIIFAKKRKEKEKKYVEAITYIHDPLQTYVGEFMSYLVLNKSKVAKYQCILQEQRVKEIPAKSSVVFWFSSAFKNLYTLRNSL